MGQYHKIINYTKKECLNPHKFLDGLKQLEFGCSSCGTMTALSYLLSYKESRGGGDFREGEYKGKWKGDNIGIVGDYAEEKDFEYKEGDNIHSDVYYYEDENCKDVSVDVLIELLKETYIKETYMNSFSYYKSFYSKEELYRIEIALGLITESLTEGNNKKPKRDSKGRFCK